MFEIPTHVVDESRMWIYSNGDTRRDRLLRVILKRDMVTNAKNET